MKQKYFINEYIGKKFGELTVVRIGNNINTSPRWLCECSCGAETHVQPRVLFIGRTRSCGCKRVEFFIKKRIRHGLSSHPLMRIWADMKQRCNNKNHKSYKDYGGRGISVCTEWDKFEKFYNDVNKSYIKGMSLDRINNNSGYNKNNFKWSSSKEQSNNTRWNLMIEHNGKNMSLQMWLDYLNIKRNYVDYRRRLGWPIKKALGLISLLLIVSCTSPQKNIKVYTGDSKTASIQRLQDGDVITTTNPAFDKMLCLDGEDFWRLAVQAEKCN